MSLQNYLTLFVFIWLGLMTRGEAKEPIALGSRRILFVDDYLIERREGLEVRLHRPTPRETVMTFDAPWEGSGSDFERLLRVGDTLRMYYMATELTSSDGKKKGDGRVFACMVESKDGIHWHRPNFGLFDFDGSKENNILWAEPKLDNLTPFQDTNPDCLPDARFKATAGIAGKLYGLKSPDGIHWSRIQAEPIVTEGKFDTQNDAFWDPVRHQYWCYLRGFHDAVGGSVTETDHGSVGIRDIRVAVSKDFRTWSAPRRLDFADAPDEALYTSQIELYPRAPDLFVGFPTRYVDRNFTPAALQALPDPEHRQRRMAFSHRYGTVVTDGLFMTSRDGYHFHRWEEAFIPPGPERSNNWVYGDGYQSLGLIETPAEDKTAAPEYSVYVDEGHWKDGETLRRYTLRLDGFVSLRAQRKAGELLTSSFTFAGNALSLNFATSAAGAVRVEIQGADGQPMPGFALNDCDELFGDRVDRRVTWKNEGRLAGMAGKPVRLRIVMTEADLFSLKFED